MPIEQENLYNYILNWGINSMYWMVMVCVRLTLIMTPDLMKKVR